MAPRLDPIDTIFNLSIPEPNSGCWLWVGSVDKDGYSKARSTTGHKLSYTTFRGSVPAGYEIDHKCKVRCCVNPDHLEAITHAENVSRGDYKSNHRNRQKTHCKRGHPLSGDNLYLATNGARQCRICIKQKHKTSYQPKNPNVPMGRNHNAKMSKNDILYIRKMYPQENLGKLAQRFGVSRSTISRVFRNIHYRDLLPY